MVEQACENIKVLLDDILAKLPNQRPVEINVRSGIADVFRFSGDLPKNDELLQKLWTCDVLQSIERYFAYQEFIEVPQDDALGRLLRQLREIIIKEFILETGIPKLEIYRTNVRNTHHMLSWGFPNSKTIMEYMDGVSKSVWFTIQHHYSSKQAP